MKPFQGRNDAALYGLHPLGEISRRVACGTRICGELTVRGGRTAGALMFWLFCRAVGDAELTVVHAFFQPRHEDARSDAWKRTERRPCR